MLQLPEMLQLLPDEILLMILENLNPAQLAKVKRVCKKLNAIVTPQIMERAARYVNYRGPHKISNKLNFFSWDTNAEIFQQMKINSETCFGFAPSKFTITYPKTPDGSPDLTYTFQAYIIQDADTKEPLGYFGKDCQKLNSDKKLPMLNNLYHAFQKRISVLIQKNYILISDCMDFMYLFDGKNFIAEYFWTNPKALEKACEKLGDKAESLLGSKTNKETQTVSILSLGENKYLTISIFGEIRVWSVTLENNKHKISPTSDFNQIELPKYPNIIIEPTQIEKAIFTKNNNILLACSGHKVIILNKSLELIKELDLKKYKKIFNSSGVSLSAFWGMTMDPQQKNWPLLESLSKHNLIIIPPKTNQILVLDETEDFATYSIQLPEIDSINLGVILKSGEILLVTETNFELKDLEVHFPYHNDLELHLPSPEENSTSPKCNIS